MQQQTHKRISEYLDEPARRPRHYLRHVNQQSIQEKQKSQKRISSLQNLGVIVEHLLTSQVTHQDGS